MKVAMLVLLLSGCAVQTTHCGPETEVKEDRPKLLRYLL